MFQLFIQRLQLPPYNFNYDVIREIIRFIPFHQAIEMGANESQLDYIGKTSPPEEASLIGKMDECNFLFKFRIPSESQKPWFVTDVPILEYMFRTRPEKVLYDLGGFLEYTNIDQYNFARPAFLVLAPFGRPDLVDCVYRNAPHLFDDTLLMHAARGVNVEYLQDLIKNKPGRVARCPLLKNAIKDGNLDTMEYLMNVGAFLGHMFDRFCLIANHANVTNWPLIQLMCLACTKDQTACNRKAFYKAIEYGNFAVVKFLVENFPYECKIADGYKRAAYLCRLEIMQYFIPNYPECIKPTRMIRRLLDKEDILIKTFMDHCEHCAKVYSREKRSTSTYESTAE